jgi:hypothetical protein
MQNATKGIHNCIKYKILPETQWLMSLVYVSSSSKLTAVSLVIIDWQARQKARSRLGNGAISWTIMAGDGTEYSQSLSARLPGNLLYAASQK